MEPKYPDVEVELEGRDGNAWFILGRVQMAMRQAGVPKEDIEEVMTEAMNGDYDHLLRTVMATVTVY